MPLKGFAGLAWRLRPTLAPAVVTPNRSGIAHAIGFTALDLSRNQAGSQKAQRSDWFVRRGACLTFCQTFSGPFSASAFNLSPSTARFLIRGPRQVVPSEDYSHRPP